VLTLAIGKTIQGDRTTPTCLDAASLIAGPLVREVDRPAVDHHLDPLPATREQVQVIFIDPKRSELGVYADIPHLKAEVVVEPKKAANALRWAVAEMERRYRLLAEVHVRSIDYYNRAIQDPEVRKRLALNEESGEARA
jgi:S-DNA-T family DNA segregation ATPase FtsK/SpoIIIE